MRAWGVLLGGLILWTAHFFGLYALSSLFPGTTLARVLVVVATLLCLVVGCWLLWRSAGALRSAQDEVEQWSLQLATLACALSVVAIAYQGLPALIS